MSISCPNPNLNPNLYTLNLAIWPQAILNNHAHCSVCTVQVMQVPCYTMHAQCNVYDVMRLSTSREIEGVATPSAGWAWSYQQPYFPGHWPIVHAETKFRTTSHCYKLLNMQVWYITEIPWLLGIYHSKTTQLGSGWFSTINPCNHSIFKLVHIRKVFR